MKRIVIALLIVALTSSPLSAQRVEDAIEYQPVPCVRPDELPVLQLNLKHEGEIRAYFRLVNSTVWCWVRGSNLAEASTVVLPRFRPNEEVEYFFILLEKNTVIAKSPVLYRVKVQDRCETMIARHHMDFAVDCSHEVKGAANSMIAAGKIKLYDERPPHISPDTPDNQ